jgi:hypothetical protein
MSGMSASFEPRLRRLARRLAVGLFLDEWPRWAAASLLVAGLVALVCRLFFAAAAPALPWLWLVPFAVAVPVLIFCFLHAYRPAEVIAVADWLSGGHGLLLTLDETGDSAWIDSERAAALSRFELPTLQPWRKLAPVPPAIAFLALALWIPQRFPPDAKALADQIATDLTTAVVELKQQELITEAEQERLHEEIERIRQSAKERVDASAWEAADALREEMSAALSNKTDAAKWAEESLARYAAAAEAGGSLGTGAAADAAEFSKALEKLAESGMLVAAPADLKALAKGGKLPADARALRQLQASLAKYLSEMSGRMASAGTLGKEAGRFDPAEFPLASEVGPDGDGIPGSGAANRGRADADLTWGKETASFDKFKAKPLPPGAARSADDWSPVVELPGAPQESPELSRGGAARQYDAVAGQSAWRRNLAPRHQSAVKKYFQK